MKNLILEQVIPHCFEPILAFSASNQRDHTALTFTKSSFMYAGILFHAVELKNKGQRQYGNILHFFLINNLTN